MQPRRRARSEARERGNSVYFPRRVIPMLPEELSNGLCSLNPEVERLCMVCDMAIGARGDIKDYRFYPAVMRSHARLTYTEVAAILADPNGPAGAQRAATGPASAESARRCTACWSQAREQPRRDRFRDHRNADGVRRPGQDHRIVPVQRNDAHA